MRGSDSNVSNFVVAGWAAQQDQWFEIERKWESRLKKENDPYPIHFFSVKDCKHLRNDFSRFRDKAKYPGQSGKQAASKLRSDLIAIVKAHRAVGFSVIIDLKAYRQLQKNSRARQLLAGDPYTFAYASAMVFLAAEVAAMQRPEMVAFLIDSHNKTKALCDGYEGLKQYNPKCSKWMGSLTEMSDKKSFALQAADLLAGACKDLATAVILDKHAISARDRFIGEFGRSTGVKLWDQHSLEHFVRANSLTNGKPGLYSSMQSNMLGDLFSRRATDSQGT